MTHVICPIGMGMGKKTVVLNCFYDDINEFWDDACIMKYTSKRPVDN